MYTYEQDMISVLNRNKINLKLDKWNHFNSMPMLSLLGAYNCLPLLHMAIIFIWIKEGKTPINEFSIIYMNNPNLNTNKAFKKKVTYCMKIHLVQ